MNALTTNNKTWLDTLLREQNWSHALTLNFTTGRYEADPMALNRPMTPLEYQYEAHRQSTANTSRWTYSSDQDQQTKLQSQAEALIYRGLLRIKQQLYGPRCYKKNNMSTFIVFEYGDKEHKLHAHCLLDLSDYRNDDEALNQAIKRGIHKADGIANNEYDLQPLYTQDSGYDWIDYISKHIDYSSLKNIDWRNSTIK